MSIQPYSVAVCGGKVLDDPRAEHKHEFGRMVARELAANPNVRRILTGACFGFPQIIAEEIGKLNVAASEIPDATRTQVIGISPWKSLQAHHEHGFPTEGYDDIFFTGVGRIRNALLIASADTCLSVGGNLGTATETLTALNTGKPTAVLQGHGPFTDHFGSILGMLEVDRSKLPPYTTTRVPADAMSFLDRAMTSIDTRAEMLVTMEVLVLDARQIKQIQESLGKLARRS